jgi:Ras-related GTP-binding protein A/B
MFPVHIRNRKEEAMRSYESDEGLNSGLFDEVACLIFVMDIQSVSPKTDLGHFELVLEALRSRSPDALVYVLLHKTDLLLGANSYEYSVAAQKAIKDRKVEVEKRALPTLIQVYHTSIWDESLYKAWSSIVHAIVPAVSKIEASLGRIAEELRADEVVLFEPNTLLMVAQAIRHAHPDHHRFEKISSIVKQFRMACKAARPVRFVVRTEGHGVAVVIERLQDEDAVLMVTTRHHHQAPPSLASIKLTDH